MTRQPTTEDVINDRNAREYLASRGYSVAKPAEKIAHSGSMPETFYEKILSAYQQRILAGSGGRLPKTLEGIDPTGIGLTDAEVSIMLDHPSLHRRCAELRSLGLLTDRFDGYRYFREADNGVRGVISTITPLGLASLRFIRQSRTDTGEE